LHGDGRALALRDEFLQARLAGRDDGNFSAGEQSIDEDEKDDDQKLGDDDGLREPFLQ
jgi:hypothetical protein